jgi:hypothetical protein
MVQDSIAKSDGLIVGPSHVIRWRHLVENKSIDRPSSPQTFVGSGGLPVWSARNLNMAYSRADDVEKMLYIVGDFRFGNSICGSIEEFPLFTDGYIGVEQGNLNEHCDLELYKKCTQALEVWRSTFESKIRILHWSLLGRQVLDRLKGKYIHEKVYKHPVWNLSDFIVDDSGSDIIDLRPLQSLPMFQVMRLFLDEDIHPTHAGYLFIANMFYDNDEPIHAFATAVDAVERTILQSIPDNIEKSGSTIAITGHSIWLDTLCRYMGPLGLAKMRAAGVLILPLNQQLGIVHSNVADELAEVPTENIFVISRAVSYEYPIGSDKSDFPSISEKSTIISWEHNCAELITRRREVPLFPYEADKDVLPAEKNISLSDDCLELGRRAEPTLKGLLHVMNVVFNSRG